jgi:hypothetical protein
VSYIVLVGYYLLAQHCPLTIYSPLYSPFHDSLHQRAVTFTSHPIDDMIRDHLIINDGTVLIRNATSSDSSCYALYSKIDPADDDTPIFDAGIVFGTGTMLFVGDETTTTTTNDVRPREDTGEVMNYETSSLRGNDNGLIESYGTCRIRFDFQCVGYPDDDGYHRDARKVIDFGYVFASEEYRDGNRGYDGTSSSAGAALGNDALVISLNGENVALVPVYDDYGAKKAVVPIAIDTINSKTNSRYFVDYVLDGRIISSEGFTAELGPYHGEEEGEGHDEDASGGSKSVVLPGWNTIEFFIGDVGDINVDSWAFLKANSFACVIVDGGGGFGDGEGEGESVMTSTGDDSVRDWAMATPRISLLMAIVIVVVLGLIALSLPVIGLTFYKKKLPSSKVSC